MGVMLCFICILLLVLYTLHQIITVKRINPIGFIVSTIFRVFLGVLFYNYIYVIPLCMPILYFVYGYITLVLLGCLQDGEIDEDFTFILGITAILMVLLYF